jgi:hypothetical protein
MESLPLLGCHSSPAQGQPQRLTARGYLGRSALLHSMVDKAELVNLRGLEIREDTCVIFRLSLQTSRISPEGLLYP